MENVDSREWRRVQYLEPVDGAAADERREHAQSVAERVADGAHREHDVQVATNSLREEVVHRQRRRVDPATLPAVTTPRHQTEIVSGAHRGTYSLYPRHVRALMLPKKRD